MNDSKTDPYSAVLADLERRKAEIETAIATIRAISGGSSTGSTAPIEPPVNGTGAASANVQIRSDSFVGMSIVEASKKYLGMVKAPQSTAILVEVLTKGGVPKPLYNTVYAVLARQERTFGDVVKLPSKEWALQEWYPGAVRRKKNASDQSEEGGSESNE